MADGSVPVEELGIRRGNLAAQSGGKAGWMSWDADTFVKLAAFCRVTSRVFNSLVLPCLVEIWENGRRVIKNVEEDSPVCSLRWFGEGAVPGRPHRQLDQALSGKSWTVGGGLIFGVQLSGTASPFNLTSSGIGFTTPGVSVSFTSTECF